MRHKLFRRLTAIALSAALAASLAVTASASGMTYVTPTAPTTVDDDLILIAAHAQADVMPEVLGITNTTDRVQEVPADYDLAFAQSSALIGTFGTDINEYPNPYLYNWAYNSYASENGLPLTDLHTLGGLSGNPNSVDTEVSEEWGGTSRSLYYRPDILLGTTGGDYNALVADLPENRDDDPSNDYDPYIVNYAMTRTYDFLDTMFTLANICDEITAETGKTTRYEDPLTIANDVTKYAKGLQAYVLSRLDADGADQKVVAIVDPINSKDGIFYCVDENTSVQGTTTCSRAGEFLADTTVNIVDVLGKTSETGAVGGAEGKTYYILTAEEIAQADVIIISGVQNQDGSEDGFRELLIQYIDPAETALIEKVETVPMMATRFSCVGSIGANSVENLLGMAYWTAFCYPEYLNPVYVATYWYENFYHISDNSSLQTAIATNLASASIPDGYGYTTDISGYSAADIEDKIVTGLHYYEDHADQLSGLLLANYGNNGSEKWVVDWTSGIGAQPQQQFTDVPTDAWYYGFVNTVVDKGLFAGNGDGTFAPEANMTYAEFLVVLNQFSGQAVTPVSGGNWYDGHVNWARENGVIPDAILSGFDPEAAITRQDMAALFGAFLSIYDYSAQPVNEGAPDFSDDAQIAGYAKDGVTLCYQLGIMGGNEDGTFAPANNAIRAEVAVTMVQMARVMGR